MHAWATFVCMRKHVNLDADLLREARRASGAKTDTETICLGLELIVQHEAYRRLAALGGTEPDAADVPRRREKPVKGRKRRAA